MGCSGDRYINDHSGAQHWSVLLDVGSFTPHGDVGNPGLAYVLDNKLW